MPPSQHQRTPLLAHSLWHIATTYVEILLRRDRNLEAIAKVRVEAVVEGAEILDRDRDAELGRDVPEQRLRVSRVVLEVHGRQERLLLVLLQARTQVAVQQHVVALPVDRLNVDDLSHVGGEAREHARDVALRRQHGARVLAAANVDLARVVVGRQEARFDVRVGRSLAVAHLHRLRAGTHVNKSIHREREIGGWIETCCSKPLDVSWPVWQLPANSCLPFM